MKRLCHPVVDPGCDYEPQRVRLKTVPLNAKQPTIAIAGIHPETLTESFSRFRLSGGYAHVVKGARH
jgi:hypothetical protein